MSFVELEGRFLVKFGLVEDWKCIMNLATWLSDECLFSMVPFVKDRELTTYEFTFVPFWIMIYNMPFDMGRAVREVLVIDWRDREGCWIKYMTVQVRLDTVKPLKRVVYMVAKDGKEVLCAIKYECLPTFCYVCGRIGHNAQRCDQFSQGMSIFYFQFSSLLLVQLMQVSQGS